MWYRTCPQCHRVFIKKQMVKLTKWRCGWIWGDSDSPERRGRPRQTPTNDMMIREAETSGRF
jgi:rubredoxin